jgi:hypothetical protein
MGTGVFCETTTEISRTFTLAILPEYARRSHACISYLTRYLDGGCILDQIDVTGVGAQSCCDSFLLLTRIGFRVRQDAQLQHSRYFRLESGRICAISAGLLPIPSASSRKVQGVEGIRESSKCKGIAKSYILPPLLPLILVGKGDAKIIYFVFIGRNYACQRYSS